MISLSSGEDYGRCGRWVFVSALAPRNDREEGWSFLIPSAACFLSNKKNKIGVVWACLYL